MEYAIKRANYRRDAFQKIKKKEIISYNVFLYLCFVSMVTCLIIWLFILAFFKSSNMIFAKEKVLLYKPICDSICINNKEEKVDENIFDFILPCNGIITSRFGSRNSSNPIVSKNHMGIDIGAPKGTKIVAAHDGKVIKSGQFSTYGNCIMIEKDNLITVYAHCSKLLVKEDCEVKKGEKIAEVGMTGNATGDHLHFEIRYNGEFINPEDVMNW